MKRKIAFFGSGWASQILAQYLEGFSQVLKGTNTDIYLFLCYPSWASTPEDRHGEFNIFRLPQLEKFDGAVIFANGLEFKDEIEFLVRSCRKAGIPAISLGMKFDGLYFVGADNVAGMRKLCEHLVTEHGIRNPFFLAGSKENPDSNLRLDVLKDVMKKNGLEFDESRLFYTNWENSRTIDFVNNYCKSGKELPDAFICANDGLAMNTCLALQNNGYAIPEDTIVTGFDNLFDAKVYDPSISSVNQNYEQLGKESGTLFKDLFNGVKRDHEIIVPSSFFISESCCPSKSMEIDILRRRMCRNHYSDRNSETQLDRKLNYTERMLLSGQTFKDIRENMIKALDYEFKYEGDSFHLVLDPSYEMSIYDKDTPLLTNGYGSKMFIAVSMEKGVISDKDYFKTSELIPDHKEDGEDHLYVFLPFHERDITYGYCIMCDCNSEVGTHFFLRYLQRLNITLERYRQKLNLDELNRKLTDITRIDALTHVKNRMAYDNKAEELLAGINSGRKTEFAIAMFDINNLKMINDEMGHNEGDAYIINSSRLICKTFKHSPIFRIGGDEFLAVLTKEDYKNRYKLLETMEIKMEELQKEDVSPVERVSIASGIAEYEPERDTSVEDVFKRSDAIMYRKKQDMKGGKAR